MYVLVRTRGVLEVNVVKNNFLLLLFSDQYMQPYGSRVPKPFILRSMIVHAMQT